MNLSNTKLKDIEHDITFMVPINPVVVMDVVDDLQTTRQLIEDAIMLMGQDYNLQYNDTAKAIYCKLREALCE